jgi:hypothetical protein
MKWLNDFNAGNFFLRRIFSILEGREPPAHCNSQRLEFKTSMSVGEPLNFCKASSKKIFSALAIRSGIMVERRRDLDYSLQEHFFRIASCEPDFLPMLMGLVKVAGIEGFKSFAKKSIFVVRFHQPCALAKSRAGNSTAS